jgi:glutathione S-transferase
MTPLNMIGYQSLRKPALDALETVELEFARDTPAGIRRQSSTNCFDGANIPTERGDDAMKLYDLELSGNCYKIRLFASLLKLPLEILPVDFLGGEHKRPEMLQLNAFAEIPVLRDGDIVLRDSQAILMYLARKANADSWFPKDAHGEAEVAQWLFTAANEIARGPNDARLHDKFGYKLDVALARTKANRVIDLIERHLARGNWLALDRPTIADIACFPYVAIGWEGAVGLDPYPNVRAWISRIKALPGYIPMPGMDGPSH